MSKNSWDHIPLADVKALNELAETMEYGSTTLGHQERRRLALLALKNAYELGEGARPKGAPDALAEALPRPDRPKARISE